MKSPNSKIIFFVATILLAACGGPTTSNLQSEKPYTPPPVTEIPTYDKIPDQTFQWIREDGGQSQLNFNPQVDILFLIDNSGSMKTAQEKLSSNIEQFAAGIINNRMIDYHIGVISVWDSSERFAKANKSNYGIGDLHFVKNSAGQSTGQRYVTKENRSKNVLASSINIGVTPYDQGGPENEEFFAPLAAALEKTGRGASNEGFFRAEAQLVVIVMTDADEYLAKINPSEMARKLIDLKAGHADKVSVYGVLVNKSTPDKFKDPVLVINPQYHSECFDMSKATSNPPRNDVCKESFGPDLLEKFVVEANVNAGTPAEIRASHIMDIQTENFGKDLEVIGNSITVKTLEKEIYLHQRPRVQDNELMIRVMYGLQEIPQAEESGWTYDPANNSIHLSGNIVYNYVEGARFTVDLVPLTVK